MRKFARQAGKIVLIFMLAYLFPKIVLFYLACGVYDVSRNSARTPELIEKYFLGNGLLTWLLSPVNTLLDLISLPYVNKGVYKLEDLPPGHRAEIVVARLAIGCGSEQFAAHPIDQMLGLPGLTDVVVQPRHVEAGLVTGPQVGLFGAHVQPRGEAV